MATEELDRRAAAERAIVEAASDLLEEGSSYAALSVEQVARRAGIGRTAFYFYFRDKRALLMRLTEEISALLYAEADRWWHGGADLRESLGRTAALYLEHSALLRTVVEAAASDDEVRRSWVALVGRFVDATRERIELDRASGRAAPVPPAETATALVWMCERTLYHFARERGGEDPAPLVEALAQVFERSIYGRLPG